MSLPPPGDPSVPSPPPLAPSPRFPRWFLALLGLLGILILVAAAAFIFLGTGPTAVLPIPDSGDKPASEIPPALRPYYEKAATGDASAMRMLGTMYYNGLNVPKDTRAGLRWYRKAAKAGSVAARKDLEQLGLPAGNE